MVAEDFSHLLPSSQTLMRLTNEERIKYIRADHWIGYTQATTAIEKLHALLTYPERQRMPNLLIIGPTNNGKTMIIQKFLRLNPPQSSRNGTHENIPVLSVQMPTMPDLKRFYNNLLYKLNVPELYNFTSLPKLETTVLRFLKVVRLKMLVIDEIHNILAGKNDQRHNFLNFLRFLGNELKIPLICVGIKDAYMAIRSDEQLENRFEPFLLPRWENNKEFRSLLASFGAILPLKKRSKLYQPVIAEKILTLSEGVIGEISKILSLSALKAIETGHECIDDAILKEISYHSPIERKKIFERVLN